MVFEEVVVVELVIDVFLMSVVRVEVGRCALVLLKLSEVVGRIVLVVCVIGSWLVFDSLFN